MTPRRRFRFIRELAAGGFGKVYVAEMITTDNFSSVVAIKLLHGQWTTHEEIAQRARDEARLLGRLRHRNIVRVEDLTSIRGQAAVIMEYLEGVDLKSLSTFLTERGERMPLPATFEMIGAVASALEAAYNHVPLQGGEPLRLIHRDIKPSNVILTIGGDTKLLDFGTARANFEDREAKTQALAFGSQAYMAPERLLGDPDTPAADIFSLGVTVYELISGVAFGKIHIRPERYNRALDERLQQLDLSGQEPEIQDKIRRLLGSMLSYDPDGRPSAVQVMESMEVLAEEAAGPSIRRFARQAVTGAMQANPHVPEDDELSGVTLFEDRSASFDTEGLGDATIPPPEPEDYVSTPRPIPLATAIGASPLEAIRTPPALQPARTVYPDSLPPELSGQEISEDVVRPGDEPNTAEQEIIPDQPEPPSEPIASVPPVDELITPPIAEASPPAEPPLAAPPEPRPVTIPPPEPRPVTTPPPEPRPVTTPPPEPRPVTPPEPSPEVWVEPQVQREPEQVVQVEQREPEQKKKGKGGIIAAAIIALLAVGGGFVALSGGGDKPPQPPDAGEVKPKPPEPPVKPPDNVVVQTPVEPPKTPDTPPTNPPEVVRKDPVVDATTDPAPTGEVGGLRLMVLPIGAAELSINSTLGYKKDWDGGGARLDLDGLAKGTYRTKVSPKDGGVAQRGTINVEPGKVCTYKIDLGAGQSDWQLVGCE